MAKSIGSKHLGPHIDKKGLDAENDSTVERYDEVNRLGEQFLADLGKIDARIKAVKSSRASEDDKRVMLSELMEARNTLQSEYDNRVSQEASKLHDETRGQIDRSEEGAREFRSQAADVKAVDFAAGSGSGLDAAAEEANRKAAEFEQQASLFKSTLQSRIEMMERQRRQMMRDQMSGR